MKKIIITDLKSNKYFYTDGITKEIDIKKTKAEKILKQWKKEGYKIHYKYKMNNCYCFITDEQKER